MNVIIATLILAGIPVWQMIQNLEHNKIGAGAINAVQIIVYILLMRGIM